MKRFLICCVLGILAFSSQAQWRRQYVPADELRGLPSEWHYIYEDNHSQAIVFSDSGMMLVCMTDGKTFKCTQDYKLIALIGVYKGDNLVSKGKYILDVTPDMKAAGADGFKHILYMIRNQGVTVRVIIPTNDFYDYDLKTIKMYVGTQVKFNQTKQWIIEQK